MVKTIKNLINAYRTLNFMKTQPIFLLAILLSMSFSLCGQKTQYNLMECLAIASENSIAIKQALLDVENAEISNQQAKANFFPNINASLNHSWNIGLNQNITTGLLENITTQFSSASISMNNNVYNGKRKFLELYRSNLTILSNNLNLEEIRTNIFILVANAYLQIMLNRELYQVNQIQLELSKTELDRTKNLIQAGVLIPSEVHELEANIASQEQTLIVAENNLRISKISLAQILLITDYEHFDIDDEKFNVPFSSILAVNPKDIYNKAVEARATIKISKTNVDLAASDLAISKTALLPSLSAYYSYNTRISYSDRLVGAGTFTERPIGVVEETGQKVITQVNESKVVGPIPFFDQWTLNDGHNFGLSLSIPILNGKAARSNVNRSLVNLQKAEEQYQQDRLNFESTINEAYNSARGAYRLYQASLKTENFRENAYQVAQNRFQAGTLNAFELVQAQQRYEIAASDLIRSKYDYILKLKVLELYFGLPLNIEDIIETAD